MPSVPQSLPWISLVVLWLFILVPMLISKRDAVGRTSVALATRVLNSGASARKLMRGGPAAGHRSDPDWQPAQDVDDDLDGDDEEEPAPKAVVVSGLKAAASYEDPDYLDVVVEEDSGALPVGSKQADDEPEDVDAEPVVTAVEDVEDEHDADDSDEADDEEEPVTSDEDGTSDEYEYVEDTSGLESGEEPPTTLSPAASRRRLYESKTAAAVIARKYKFRKRVISVMAVILAASVAAVFTVWPGQWWLCGATGAVTVLYLAYLRRQTRIEERLRRRRRAQRMARSRLGVENTADRTFDVTPSRLRQPAVQDVLKCDHPASGCPPRDGRRIAFTALSRP
jgi:hypothetical protein